MNNDNATQWFSQNAGDLCNADIDAVVLKHSPKYIINPISCNNVIQLIVFIFNGRFIRTALFWKQFSKANICPNNMCDMQFSSDTIKHSNTLNVMYLRVNSC